MLKEHHRSVFIVGLFLALHLILAYWRPLPLWGLDLLAYHPKWIQGLFVFFGILILIPSVRCYFFTLRNLQRYSKVFVLLVGSVAFLCLPSAVHLLGDGYLYIQELSMLAEYRLANPHALLRSDRAPLLFWVIERLHGFGVPFWGSGEMTYRVYSTLSGILYLVLIWPVAVRLGQDNLQRTIIVGFLVTPGFMQLFFGYAETYPLLLPVFLIYLFFSLHSLQDDRFRWLPALLLGILIACHFLMVSLLPSLLILAIFQGRAQSIKASGLQLTVKSIAYFCVSAITTCVIFVLVGFNPFSEWQTMGSSNLLPIFSDPDFNQPYRMFSGHHLLDVFNQYILAAPSALMVLCLLRKQNYTTDPKHVFLLVAAGFPLLISVMANAEIGAFRDWDVFAYPALPLTLWAALALTRQEGNKQQVAHTAFLICGATVLHSLVWIGLNAHAPSAEARFSNLLERSQLSLHARAYGWETLARWYRDEGKTEQAAEAYQKALIINPENPRYWLVLGDQYIELGRNKEALDAYRQSSQVYSNSTSGDVGTDILLGNAFYKLSVYEKSIEHYQKAARIDVDNAGLQFNLGNAFYNLGKYEKSIEHYLKAVDLSPEFDVAYSNMASAYSKLGKSVEAEIYFEKSRLLKAKNQR